MKLVFKVNKPAMLVLDYLTDMQKFVSVHPVITKITSTEDNSYLVHETLKLGFIPFSFTYPVVVETNIPAQHVTIRARVMKLTKVTMQFSVTSDKGLTTIEETLHFATPLPVKGLMLNIFKKQHAQLFKNIELLGQ